MAQSESAASHERLRPLRLLGREGDSFATTRLETLINWARKYSLAPYAFNAGCCAPEFVAANGPRHDLDRLGTGMPRYSAEQADLLLVLGTVTHRLARVLRETYERMVEPRWVMAAGACACTGGLYANYATVQGVDQILPVDLFLPGCPPSPEVLIHGLETLQTRVQLEHVPRTGRRVAARVALAGARG